MLLRITGLEHPYLQDIQTLYETSFPVYERRLWNEFLTVLSDGNMHLEVIERECQFVGLVTWWQIEHWMYLEHFAIVPEQRNKKYGEQVITYLKQLSNNNLILETELPNNEDAIRRIRFYKRLGFFEVPIPYMQPPYRKTGEGVPMQLMAAKQAENPGEYKELILSIKQQVYEKFY